MRYHTPINRVSVTNVNTCPKKTQESGDIYVKRLFFSLLVLVLILIACKTADPQPSIISVGDTETYSGILAQNDPKFIRPDDSSGLPSEARTNPFQVTGFKVEADDFYQIDSEQSFDGYILLYENSFDETQPSENLLAENDDFGGGYNPNNDPPGFSSLKVALQTGKTYFLVTTACGDPNAGCGPNLGSFSNTISAGAEPPLPVETLPEPDTENFNITIIFARDEVTESLTEAQKQVFIDAAERWSQIIREDIEDFDLVSPLPEEFVFPKTPPLQGVIDDVLIYVRFAELGGPLGSAGPRNVRLEDSAHPNLPLIGLMQFEIAEFEPGGFFEDEQAYQDVIVHEMGHVIGIGTIWDITNNVDDNYIANDPPTVPPGLPNPDYDPGFTGAGAVAEYNSLQQALGQEPSSVIPIANTGGPGNYNGHWREFIFEEELMTPYAAGIELLSRMTAASLGDLGYSVDLDSDAVDQDYELRERVPAEFEQLSPNTVTYTEFEDFIAFAGDPAFAEGEVEPVDINLEGDRASDSGCEASDFDAFIAGKVALIQRGSCPFIDKFANAKDAGAIGVIVFNQGDTEERKGLFGASNNQDIPAVATTFELGEALAGIIAGGETLRVRIDTGTETSLISPAAVAPQFREEVLKPIGSLSPTGKTLPFQD